MVAYSKTTDRLFRGSDFSIKIAYQPPEGESREGMVISAALVAQRLTPTAASSVSFDPATGEIVATWEEPETARLSADIVYEARFTRAVDGATRVFYVRRVQVQ
ncbi:hypothetical protein [Antarcticirhabdus aurantiaca]|uniref:Uncharacterized protein n=1 Tax=Antarcticirhabdus aurantiaca TaxID=2606717 RepID=A0ACD4NJB7_9HYPH|nr:hypothetical protein OXU80_18475 [Jeongeuplla avenae]